MESATVPQNIVALERANVIRLRRSELKAGLKGGELRLEEVMDDPASATWALGDLLAYLPVRGRRVRQGRVNKAPTMARRVLNVSDVSPTRKVGALTRRERDVVLKAAKAMVPRLPR